VPQLNWTFVSDSGQRHIVGLFHGERTGHLLVHCNSRVVLIDFHVLRSKNYSFFIEDELLEIKLEKKDDRFSYNFDINKLADTPKNRLRWAEEKKNLRLAIAFAGALILCVAAVFFGLRHSNRVKMEDQRAVLLSQRGGETTARIDLPSDAEFPGKVAFSFVADSRAYRGAGRLEQALAPNGMPLETGDEFVVRYAIRAPSLHEIDFSRPTERQVARYRQRALDKHAAFHPSLSSERVACVVDVLFAKKGLAAYANIFHQDQTAQANPEYNRQTYLELIDDPEVRATLSSDCAGK
jgi:hypothetical protein